ncbi:calcium-binding protein [Planctomycetota bacterium]
MGWPNAYVNVTITDSAGGSATWATEAVTNGVGVNNGILQVVGTNSDDKITVKQTDPDVYQVKIRQKGNSTSETYSISDPVSRVDVYGRDGGDMITLANSVTVASALNGGNDDDLIYGGQGNDTIDGGAGNDKLFGRSGNDIIYGRDGHDRLWGKHGDDLLDGGDGEDKISGGAGKDTIYGGADDDVIWGSDTMT